MRSLDSSSSAKAANAAALVLLTVTILVVCRAVLLTDQSFGFRDAGHFYIPLWDWCRQQWATGRIPLWNPLENFGTPVIGDGTSSVFYPGQLIFALPYSTERLFSCYIAGHYLLAAATMFRASRAWRHSVTAATIAALSYSLGGSILFQHCNPIFLVSAAWLPLALMYGRQLFERAHRGSAFKLAVVLAMMILGGDPQQVYHVGIALFVLSWLRLWQWRSKRTWSRSELTPPAGWFRIAFRLGLVAVFTAGLAAIQLLPTTEQTQNSWRATYDSPRSIYEAAVEVQSGREANLADLAFARCPDRQEDDRLVFDYSVGPWRWLELLIPTAGGNLVPENHRWMSALPAESRPWTMSLYMGLLPIALAWSAIRRRSQSASTAWLKRVAVLSIAAALGKYGLGWLASELNVFQSEVGGQPLLGWPFGGIYWLMTTVLPGYVYFRYPAKWWTMTACCLSLLAADGWDRSTLDANHRRTSRRVLLLAVLIAGGVAALIHFSPASISSRVTSTSIDSVFGPLDLDASLLELRNHCLHSLAVAVGGFLLLLIQQKWLRFTSLAIVLITASELVVAQQSLMITVPSAAVTAAAAELSADESPADEPVPTRLLRLRSEQQLPEDWSRSTEADRLVSVLKFDQEHNVGRHHLRHGQVAILPTRISIPQRDVVALLQAMELNPELPGSFQSALSYTRPPRSGAAPDRCYIARSVSVVPPAIPHALRSAALIRASEILNRMAAGETVVESSSSIDSASLTAIDDPGAVSITTYTPQQVELEVSLTQPAVVVLADQFAAGWCAESHPTDPTDSELNSWESREILRTNSVLRGVALPAGEHRLRFSYRPDAFYVGLAFSLFTWLLLLAIAWRRFSARRTGNVRCRVA